MTCVLMGEGREKPNKKKNKPPSAFSRANGVAVCHYGQSHINRNVKKEKRASKRKREKKVRRRGWPRRLLVGGTTPRTLDHRCQGH